MTIAIKKCATSQDIVSFREISLENLHERYACTTTDEKRGLFFSKNWGVSFEQGFCEFLRKFWGIKTSTFAQDFESEFSVVIIWLWFLNEIFKKSLS